MQNKHGLIWYPLGCNIAAPLIWLVYSVISWLRIELSYLYRSGYSYSVKDGFRYGFKSFINDYSSLEMPLLLFLIATIIGLLMGISIPILTETNVKK